MPDDPAQPAPPRREWRAALLLAFIAFLVYNANFHSITSSDNYPARFLPFDILHYHSVTLDPMLTAASEGRTHPYWIIPGRGGSHISQYPIVTPVLIAPLYLPALAWLDARGWEDRRVDRVARFMEKISASLVASASVALMYLLLLRRARPRIALLLAIAYAFGTNTWVIGSQGLWQHGMAELLLAGILLLVTGPRTAWRAALAGALCVLVVFNRPPDIFFAAALGPWSLWWAGRRAWWVVIAGGIVPFALLMGYNLGVAGSIVGGYGVAANAGFYRYNLAEGIAGMLFSPGRGLYVFTPFLLALPLFPHRVFRDPATRALSVLMSIAVVLQLMLYAKIDWRAGCSWGPRYLTDALPLLLWLLAPAAAAMRRPGLAVFSAGVAASIAVQAVGAFWYTGASDEAIFAKPGNMVSVWNLSNTPFLMETKHRRAPRDLLLYVEGSIDGVRAGGREASEAPAGTEIVVSGWALTDRRTPGRLFATLAPRDMALLNNGATQPAAVTLKFQPRTDIGNAPGTPEPGGWRVALPTAGLPPGDYVIETYVQGPGGGDFHSLGQHPFKLLAK